MEKMRDIKSRLEKLEQGHGNPPVEVQFFTRYPSGLFRSLAGQYYTAVEFEALRPADLPPGALWCVVTEYPSDDIDQESV
jgi:hypothetical protein